LTTVPSAPESAGLRRALGFRDLVLFYVVATFSLRWVAVAAAAGPVALLLWVVATACFFVPLVFTVLELSSRHPNEGGMYVWSKQAFGPFAAFITGWSYWSSNLPYLPGLLYFGAANALFVGGSQAQALSTSSGYFLATSLTGLAIAVALNVVGLNVGKWMSNVGAIAIWIPTTLLILFGGYSWLKYGTATPITPGAMLPVGGLKDLIFLSAIAFALAGVESASTMGDEIADPPRTVPRAILTAAVVIAMLYMLGTLALLFALPYQQLSGLQGLMQAIQAMTARAGASWMVPVLAACVTLNALGAAVAWFAATARLPFVAGLDHFLPPAFGRVHPRWHTPYVALLVQAVAAGVFVVLGQAGTSVRGAYEALVSMGIIVNFIPFLFMFAAMFRLQREPVASDVIRVPGGPGVAKVLACMGFAVSLAAIVLACVPSESEPNKLLAVVKVVGGSAILVTIGVVLYLAPHWRRNDHAGQPQ